MVPNSRKSYWKFLEKFQILYVVGSTGVDAWGGLNAHSANAHSVRVVSYFSARK